MKDEKVFTVILLLETSDKSPQPCRCHMGLGGGSLTSVPVQHPRHRMGGMRRNKRMLAFHQKGNDYQIDLVGTHQAPADKSTCQRRQMFSLSEAWVECQGCAAP